MCYNDLSDISLLYEDTLDLQLRVLQKCYGFISCFVNS
jgi:hypothetical protein